MKSMNRSWDRIVGFVTTFVVGVGAVSLIIKRVRRLLPDTYQERHHNVETDGKQTEHRGSCHCQTVSFTVIAPKSLKAFDCLAKIRYPHIVVSPSDLVVNNHDRLAQLVEHRRGATTTCFFCSKCGVHVYRTVCQDQSQNVYHLNCSLLATETVADIQVSNYEGWPGSLINVTSEGESMSQPTPIKQLTEDAATGTIPLPKEQDYNAVKPCAPEHSSLVRQNNHTVHSTSTQAVPFYGAFADIERHYPTTSYSQQTSQGSGTAAKVDVPSDDACDTHFNPIKDALGGPPVTPSRTPLSENLGLRIGPPKSLKKDLAPSLEQLRRLNRNDGT